jgi:hypothetical protein
MNMSFFFFFSFGGLCYGAKFFLWCFLAEPKLQVDGAVVRLFPESFCSMEVGNKWPFLIQTFVIVNNWSVNSDHCHKTTVVSSCRRAVWSSSCVRCVLNETSRVLNSQRIIQPVSTSLLQEDEEGRPQPFYSYRVLRKLQAQAT